MDEEQARDSDGNRAVDEREQELGNEADERGQDLGNEADVEEQNEEQHDFRVVIQMMQNGIPIAQMMVILVLMEHQQVERRSKYGE